MANTKNIMDITSVSQIYKRIRLRYVLDCAVCGPHNGENASSRVPYKSWKMHRQKQYNGSKPINRVPTGHRATTAMTSYMDVNDKWCHTRSKEV